MAVNSNDPILAQLSAEIALLRAAVVGLAQLTGTRHELINEILGARREPIERMLSEGKATVHIHAMEAATDTLLRLLGYVPTA